MKFTTINTNQKKFSTGYTNPKKFTTEEAIYFGLDGILTEDEVYFIMTEDGLHYIKLE